MAEKAHPRETWVRIQALPAVHDGAAHRVPKSLVHGASCHSCALSLSCAAMQILDVMKANAEAGQHMMEGLAAYHHVGAAK